MKLAGRGDYRIRLGDYRIVYAVDDDDRIVIVAPGTGVTRALLWLR